MFLMSSIDFSVSFCRTAYVLFQVYLSYVRKCSHVHCLVTRLIIYSSLITIFVSNKMFKFLFDICLDFGWYLLLFQCIFEMLDHYVLWQYLYALISVFQWFWHQQFVTRVLGCSTYYHIFWLLTILLRSSSRFTTKNRLCCCFWWFGSRCLKPNLSVVRITFFLRGYYVNNITLT